jgi:hypothetical protein
MLNSVFYKPLEEENPEESNPENEGAREWVPLFLSNSQETHHPTGKLSLQGHDAKHHSPSQPEGKCQRRNYSLATSSSRFNSLDFFFSGL